MSIQLENGYTRIANEILEHIARAKLNGSQFRIVMAVLRYTYGFNRKEYSFSIKDISEVTGINKRQVQRELTALIQTKVIHVYKEATFSSPASLGFNKHFDQWCLNGQQVTNQTPPDHIDTPTGDGLDTTPPDGLVTSPGDGLDVPPLFGETEQPDIEGDEKPPKDNIKDNYKDIIKKRLYDHWNTLNISNHRDMSDKISKALDKVVKRPEYFITCMNHYSTMFHDQTYKLCSYPWGLVSFIGREKGYELFDDEGEKWRDYLKHLEEQNKQANTPPPKARQPDKPLSNYETFVPPGG